MFCLSLLLLLVQDPASLAEVTPERIGADLRFLADDALGGRDTPSVGLEVAATFLEARLVRLGLAPAGRDGYRQSFPLAVRRLDPERTGLHVRGAGGARDLVFGTDYYPERLAHLVGWEVEADLVSGGTGQAPEVDARLAGRWVVLFEQEGARMRLALQRLAQVGAAGALLTPGTRYVKSPYADRFRPVAESMLAGVTTRSGGSEPAGPDLPLVMLPPETWLALRALSPVTWEEELPPAGTGMGLRLRDRRTPIDPGASASNVVARLTGHDPGRRHEVILLLAHYDGPGAPGGAVHNAADDNASGSVALLAIAEGLAAHGALGRTVVLLWTAGNAKGHLGVETWAAAPTLRPGERVVLAIELDALGLGPPDALLAGPGPDLTWHGDQVGRFLQAAAAEGFSSVGDADPTWPRSEARVIARTLEVPVVSVTAGHHATHRTASDQAIAVDTGKVARVARAALRQVIAAGG